MTTVATERSTSRPAPADGSGGPDAFPVAVVGGGISGLALARWLRESGVRAVVFDSSDSPGGVIGTESYNGFTFEQGPNTILDKSPAFNDLLDLVGLSDEALRIPIRSQERYIWHDGRLHAVPSGPGSLLTTALFSLKGKLRLLRELRVPRVDADEPLESFVRRRLGDEVYERAFLPMVQGIGAGDPSRMSAEASFPLLKELERGHGSLIRGFIRRMKSARGERNGAPRTPINIVSFPAGSDTGRGGLGRMADRIAASLGADWRGGCTVSRIARVPAGGFELTIGNRPDTSSVKAGRVVICTPADEAARLIEPFDAPLASDIGRIQYCPMIAVGLGVSARSIRIPPGFGFLAARDQGIDMLGAIFNSSFLPDRAPQGHVALTAMLGGDLRPGDLERTDDEIIGILKRDLGRVLGWDGTHAALRIIRWPRSIPQYRPGHLDLVVRMDAFERAEPGIRLFGNWRAGVSINDRIDSARALAAELVSDKSSPSTAGATPAPGRK